MPSPGPAFSASPVSSSPGGGEPGGGEPPWSEPIEDLLAHLASDPEGLAVAEAAFRQARAGRGRAPGRGQGWGGWAIPPALGLLVRQFTSPIIAILLGAALLSFVLASPSDGWIILAIVAAKIGRAHV